MRPRPTRQAAARLRDRQLHADLNAIIRTARAALRIYGEAKDEANEDDPLADGDPLDDDDF